MRKLISIFLLLFIAGAAEAQTVTRYYKDARMKKEVPESKATISQTLTNNHDGTVTTTTRRVMTGEILSSYKNGEPVGVWGGKDYDFELNYKDTVCKEGVMAEFSFKDSAAIGYIAPKMVEGKTFMDFLMKNVQYPDYAKDNDLTGKVVLIFTISKTGDVENIAVKKSAGITLDKEAVRVFRKLTFMSPAMLNGQSIPVCVIQSLRFQLD